MAPVWVSQEDKPSRTARTSQLVAFLEERIPRWMVEELVDRYFQANPGGTQVTLYVLAEIGREELTRIAWDLAREKGGSGEAAFRRVKQVAGLYVAMVLADHLGPGNVESYRRSRRGPNSQRKVPDAWLPQLSWVACYTPHRLKKSTRRG